MREQKEEAEVKVKKKPSNIRGLVVKKTEHEKSGRSGSGGCRVCGVPSRGPRPLRQQQIRTSHLRNPHYMSQVELYQVNYILCSLKP